MSNDTSAALKTQAQDQKQRVRIGDNFQAQPFLLRLAALPFIYLPVLTTIPFLIAGTLLVRAHLWLIGARDVRPYRDFLPAWASHRYRNEQHITYRGRTGRWAILRLRLFWIGNCKVYCPYSVALVAYAGYLVKIVENWWCPFDHDRKHTYQEASIDLSFWHTSPSDVAKLHEDDRLNPIWNEAQERPPVS